MLLAGWAADTDSVMGNEVLAFLRSEMVGWWYMYSCVVLMRSDLLRSYEVDLPLFFDVCG